MDDEVLGQITPDSPLGKLITSIARRSKIIVEVGTWRGMGSTLCIFNGLCHSDQQFITIDAGEDKIEEAKKRYSDHRMVFKHGRVCHPRMILTKVHPDPAILEFYDPEIEALRTAPDIISQLPDRIDFLMLDGGEWATHGDFELLMPRTRIIALDDTNGQKSEKSWRARRMLLDLGWTVIVDDLMDRNGYFIAEKQ